MIALAGLALSGAAMYLLVRYLGCGRLVASWAGLVYLAFPWHLERVMAGHASLVHLQVFPLLVLAGIAWVRKPTDGRAFLVCLAVVAAWLTSGYFGAMALIALIAFTAAVVLVQRRALGWATVAGRTAKLWTMSVLGGVFVVVVSVLAAGATGLSLGRDTSELEFYGARPGDYLPDPATPVLGDLTGRLGEPVVPYYAGVENILYPGLLTVGLALLWLVVAATRWSRLSDRVRVATLVGVGVTTVAVVLAMPSPMHVAGLRIEPMPSYLLMQVLPSFRVPSRLIVLAMAGLLVLAALALAWLCEIVRRRAGGRGLASGAVVAVCALAGLLSLAELNVLPLLTSTPGSSPAQYAAVGSAPPGAVAEYPLTVAGTAQNAEYGYWQRLHGRPLVNGPALNTDADAIRRMLVDPGAPGVASTLALLGVTSIVTRPTTLDWVKATNQSAQAWGEGYRLVGGTGTTRVFLVTAAPAPAVVAYRGPDVAEPLPPADDGFVGYPVLGPAVHLDVYAKRAGLWRMRIDARTADGLVALAVGEGARAVTSESGIRTSLDVPLHIPRGRSTITLTVRRDNAAAAAGWPDIELSRPVLEPARPGDRGRALTLTPVSTSPGF